MSAQIEKRYDVKITKQAVDKRLNESFVKFIKAVLEKAMEKTIEEEELAFLSCFQGVRIKDSTAFQLPEDMADKYCGSGGAGSRAMIRIQFEYDLKTGKIIDLSLHPFNEQDNSDACQGIDNVKEGELLIRDLGYIKISALKKIKDSGGFFINRLQPMILVFKKKGDSYEKLDFAKLEQQLLSSRQERLEIEAYIGEQEKFPVRLIVEQLPANLKQERLRKANKEAKKKGRQLGKEYKNRCGLNLFITNTDSKDVKPEHLRTLYTVRWQIELVFKAWKSLGEIHQVKKMKIERFESYLYAKLLWLVLNWRIFWAINIYYHKQKGILMSIHKMFKAFKEDIDLIRTAIAEGPKSLQAYIMKLFYMSEKKYKSEKKKNKLSLTEIMMEF